MIIFKQKEFSSPKTKAIYTVVQTGNKIKGAFGGKVAPVIQQKRKSIAISRGTDPKAVVGKALSKAQDVSRKVETAMYFPGRTANEGIKKVVENPIAVGGAIVTAPIPAPTSPIAIAAETALKKKSKNYRMATEKLGKRWKNSKLSKKLDDLTAYDIDKYIRMVPIG